MKWYPNRSRHYHDTPPMVDYIVLYRNKGGKLLTEEISSRYKGSVRSAVQAKTNFGSLVGISTAKELKGTL